MRKYIYTIISCLLFIFVLTKEIYAQPTPLAFGTPEIFRFTIKYVGVSYDDGATYYTLYNDSTGTTQDYGSASVSAGQKVYDLSLTADLPEGTINKIKLTAGAYFTYKGSVTYGGTSYYTPTASNVSPDVNPATFPATTIAASYGTITNFYIGTTATDTTAERSASIEIGPGTATLKLSVNVTNAISIVAAGPVYLIIPSDLSISFSTGS